MLQPGREPNLYGPCNSQDLKADRDNEQRRYPKSHAHLAGSRQRFKFSPINTILAPATQLIAKPGKLLSDLPEKDIML